MSIVPLNIGSAPNDGNGQDLRSGGQVINANFAELDQRAAAAQSAADGAQAAADAAIPGTQKGQPNGVAGLDGNGTVPASQLPSYVDDVLEFDSFATLPATGETGKIYITKDTNSQYRWSGTQYILLTASPGSTDAVPEGAVNKYWTLARTLGSVLTGLVTTNPAVIAATDTVLAAFGKLQKQITDLASSKANNGANSDITSLGGLTTPLSKAQGGTGSSNGIPVMAGATAAAPGVAGLAPAGAAGDQDKFLTAGGVYKEAGGAALPVGSIVPWPVSRSTLPAGWIARDGQLLNRADWPDLWALVSASAVTDAAWLAAPYTSRGRYSSGDGSTTFRMPDTNAKHADGNTIAAMFLRGDGKNSAGTAGLHAADQVQGMKHRTMLAASAGGQAGFTADAAITNGLVAGASNVNLYSSHTGGPVTDSINGAPRVGTETRPSAETVIWCTVGAGKATNPGSVDVTALATTVSQQSGRLDALESSAGFTVLYPNGGTAASPAAIGANQRYVVTNPFPGFHVFVRVDVLWNGIWSDPGWGDNAGSAGNSYGTRVSQFFGTGDIAVQTGINAVMLATSAQAGGGHGATGGALIASAQCRLKVWKLKGAA
ncbi:tail fiber protein [Pseudomonas sp. G11]|uniref:phage tail protein n=1 Tax=Pseudomonas sp. G11 TaxID=528343 RepID=UPI0024028614|nr:tail fiber protein [Pseudomonas sp. G11]WEX16290.1 tail fiber protein [Pseudomonas sp. G11]